MGSRGVLRSPMRADAILIPRRFTPWSRRHFPVVGYAVDVSGFGDPIDGPIGSPGALVLVERDLVAVRLIRVRNDVNLPPPPLMEVSGSPMRRTEHPFPDSHVAYRPVANTPVRNRTIRDAPYSASLMAGSR